MGELRTENGLSGSAAGRERNQAEANPSGR